MTKNTLSVASTEPVSLDDSDTKSAAKTEVLETSESKSDGKLTPATKEPESKEETKLDTKTDGKTAKTADTDKAADSKTSPDAAKTPAAAQLAKTDEDDAPPPPARPLSPLAQAKKDLKEAFPQIEDKYVEAVLIASLGRVDPAFNALLFLLDPNFHPDKVAVPSPRPQVSATADDELLARQLQKEFEREDRRRRAHHQGRRQKDLPPAPEDESPDEFEQIKETFTQGFEEAKTTINSWVTGLSKKFNQDEQQPQQTGRNQSPKLFGALGGSSFNNNTRNTKSFDEDPEILALDFRKNVKLDDAPPQLPKREEAKKLDEAKKPQSKWQPLNSDVPVQSDAFLVTDLEDEDKK